MGSNMRVPLKMLWNAKGCDLLRKLKYASIVRIIHRGGRRGTRRRIADSESGIVNSIPSPWSSIDYASSDEVADHKKRDHNQNDKKKQRGRIDRKCYGARHPAKHPQIPIRRQLVDLDER